MVRDQCARCSAWSSVPVLAMPVLFLFMGRLVAAAEERGRGKGRDNRHQRRRPRARPPKRPGRRRLQVRVCKPEPQGCDREKGNRGGGRSRSCSLTGRKRYRFYADLTRRDSDMAARGFAPRSTGSRKTTPESATCARWVCRTTCCHPSRSSASMSAKRKWRLRGAACPASVVVPVMAMRYRPHRRRRNGARSKCCCAAPPATTRSSSARSCDDHRGIRYGYPDAVPISPPAGRR